MKNSKIVLGEIIVVLLTALFACAPAQTSPTAANTSLPDTDTPAPSATVRPSATPTAAPFARQSKVEVVSAITAPGDGGNSWGGHQTRIVHTQDGIFTAYTTDTGDYFHKEWHLVERQANSAWMELAKGDAGREPVNLLTGPDGTLYIVGWPNGLATLWEGRPVDGSLVMSSSRIPNQLNGNWPYNSAGIDANGDLCVLSSEEGPLKGGNFYIACRKANDTHWVTRKVPLDFRYCYTYVFPDTNGGLKLVNTRDIRWAALGYTQPKDAFDYIFNAYGLWQTPDMPVQAPQRVYFREEIQTDQYPEPYLDAQQDAYVDTLGRTHVIYNLRGVTTRGAAISHHAIFSSDGSLLFDGVLPEKIGDFARIFQDRRGDFYLLGSAGYLYPMSADSRKLGSPIKLDLGGYQVEYSGFGLSVPRTGTPLSNVMDVVFPSGNELKWLYFQLDFDN